MVEMEVLKHAVEMEDLVGAEDFLAVHMVCLVGMSIRVLVDRMVEMVYNIQILVVLINMHHTNYLLEPVREPPPESSENQQVTYMLEEAEV